MNRNQPAPDEASTFSTVHAQLLRTIKPDHAPKRLGGLGVGSAVFLYAILGVTTLGLGYASEATSPSAHTALAATVQPSPEAVVPKAVISAEFTGDEAYLLIRVLEQLYDNWPSDASDPDAFYASTYEMRLQASRLKARAERAGLPPVVASLYEDYLQSLNAYVSFLEQLGVIKDTVREAAYNANLKAGTKAISSVVDTLASGGGLSLGTTSAAVIVGSVDFGVQAWGNAEKRDASETKLVKEEARRISELIDTTLTNARQAILDLGKERGWTRVEIGWDLNPATAEQQARIFATNDDVLIHREMTRYVEFRPRDPLIRLARNNHQALSAEHNPTELRQIAEDCLDTLNLIPDEDVYADYRHQCTQQAAITALLAGGAELKAGDTLKAPTAARARVLEITEYSLAQQPADPSGMLRLLVAYAHMMHGNVELAQTQAEALYPILAEDKVYQSMLADIYSQAGDWDRALRSVAASILDGNFTAEEMQSNWFLNPVREARPDDFALLITPKWSWTIDFGLMNDDIVIRNDTFYPLTNVELKLDLAKGEQTWTPTLSLDVIQPGETKVWKNVVSIPGSQLTRSGAKLICDQNRPK